MPGAIAGGVAGAFLGGVPGRTAAEIDTVLDPPLAGVVERSRAMLETGLTLPKEASDA
jgi:hypothetical protein